MKKGLRKLSSIKNTKAGDSEMGGVNEGIVRSPLQPTHGKSEGAKLPRLGAKTLPSTKASVNDLAGGKKDNTGKVKDTGKTITNSKNAKKELAGKNVGKIAWTKKSDDYGLLQANGVYRSWTQALFINPTPRTAIPFARGLAGTRPPILIT